MSSRGRPGALGTAATFSFFPSKNLEEAARTHLAVPMSPVLGESEAREVVSAVHETLGLF